MKTIILVAAVLIALSGVIMCGYMSYVHIKYHSTMSMYDFMLAYKEAYIHILLAAFGSYFLVKISDRL